LAVPIFDTLVVSFERILHGKAFYEGGKDHSSHRLVAHGLSEKRALFLLYAIALGMGVFALLGFVLNLFIVIQIVLLVVVALVVLGVFLSDVNIYSKVDPTKPKREKPFTVVVPFIPHKRRLVEIVIDAILIVVAYFTAYLVRFDWQIDPYNWKVIQDSLPIVVPVKLLVMMLMGMYAGFWKYVDFSDLKRIALSVLVASFASIVILVGFYRFSGFSRSLFFLDFMVLLLLIVGVRAGLRLLRESFYGFTKAGRRVLIVGAGEAGRWVLEEIRKNRGNQLEPVGIIDDDPWKIGRKLRGISVLGDCRKISKIVEERQVVEIIVAVPSVSEEERQKILGMCLQAGVPVKILEAVFFPSMLTLTVTIVAIPIVVTISHVQLIRRNTIKHHADDVGAHIFQLLFCFRYDVAVRYSRADQKNHPIYFLCQDQ